MWSWEKNKFLQQYYYPYFIGKDIKKIQKISRNGKKQLNKLPWLLTLLLPNPYCPGVQGVFSSVGMPSIHLSDF